MGRILVADDHDALRRGLVRGLTEAGHEVEEASNGNAAIEQPPASGREPQKPAPAVVVEVADNGPGVPAELSDKIFNPFFTTKPQGSGLGLAIVRKIVDAHDGRIDLSSSVTTGTRFRVTLPVSGAGAWFK